MVTNTQEFERVDEYLEQVRSYVLEAGKFNIDDVKSKFRVGLRRTLFLRDALVNDGTLDAVETDGQNWLSGSIVLKENEDELQRALDTVVSIVGTDVSHDFEKLVEVMGNERVYVMRLVIRAGVKSLLSLLGGR